MLYYPNNHSISSLNTILILKISGFDAIFLSMPYLKLSKAQITVFDTKDVITELGLSYKHGTTFYFLG